VYHLQAARVAFRVTGDGADVGAGVPHGEPSGLALDHRTKVDSARLGETDECELAEIATRKTSCLSC